MYRNLIKFIDDIKSIGLLEKKGIDEINEDNISRIVYFENGFLYLYDEYQIFQIKEDVTHDKNFNLFKDKKFKFDLDELIFYTKDKKKIKEINIINNDLIINTTDNIHKIFNWEKKDDKILNDIKSKLNFKNYYFSKELNNKEIELIKNNNFKEIELVDNIKMQILKKYISRIIKSTKKIEINIYNSSNNFIKIIEIIIYNSNIITHNYGKIVI